MTHRSSAQARWPILAGARRRRRGFGEYIIRVGLARGVLEALRRGLTPGEATAEGVADLVRIGGDGGVIAVRPDGMVGWAFSSE